jgi:hypothetical protein
MYLCLVIFLACASWPAAHSPSLRPSHPPSLSPRLSPPLPSVFPFSLSHPCSQCHTDLELTRARVWGAHFLKVIVALQSKSLQGEMSFFFTVFFGPPMMTHLCRRRLRLHRLSGWWRICAAAVWDYTVSQAIYVSNTLQRTCYLWFSLLDMPWEKESERCTHTQTKTRAHAHTHTNNHTLFRMNSFCCLCTHIHHHTQ